MCNEEGYEYRSIHFVDVYSPMAAKNQMAHHRWNKSTRIFTIVTLKITDRL
jgi:hypothetical protein